MFIRDLSECEEFIAGDDTRLRELFSPLKDSLDLRYSLAIARVKPGVTTRLHRLKHSEVYYVVSGTGEMVVGAERERVGSGCAIYIPPGSSQQIANVGDDELVFLCIVDPAWKAEDEEILD
jgi:mannose-6-phosphate isomerase-like protein (cupin superfamily)